MGEASRRKQMRAARAAEGLSRVEKGQNLVSHRDQWLSIPVEMLEAVEELRHSSEQELDRHTFLLVLIDAGIVAVRAHRARQAQKESLIQPATPTMMAALARKQVMA